MTVNNINDPVSQDKKLPALMLQKDPESPLQGGQIPLPPQTYCSVVKVSYLPKLHAEGQSCLQCRRQTPSRGKSDTAKHPPGHLGLTVGPGTSEQGGESYKREPLHRRKILGTSHHPLMEGPEVHQEDRSSFTVPFPFPPAMPFVCFHLDVSTC